MKNKGINTINKNKCFKCKTILNDDNKVFFEKDMFVCSHCNKRLIFLKECPVCQEKYMTYNPDSVSCKRFNCFYKMSYLLSKVDKKQPLNGEQNIIFKRMNKGSTK